MARLYGGYIERKKDFFRLFMLFTFSNITYYISTVLCFIIFSITLPSGWKIILLDTIGFITNLPVEMVEAFKSTL